MKYILIVTITLFICLATFLGMSYLIKTPSQKNKETLQTEVTQLDDIRVLNIKKLIPHHDIPAFDKIKQMPMIPIENNNLTKIEIDKTSLNGAKLKLPIKADFNKTECRFCHTK